VGDNIVVPRQCRIILNINVLRICIIQDALHAQHHVFADVYSPLSVKPNPPTIYWTIVSKHLE
jgi:hypothetical protein